MPPHLVHSLICRSARIFIIAAIAFLLLASGIQGTAQAQTGHSWNGVTGPEDVAYNGSIPYAGTSVIGHNAISSDGRFVTFSSSRQGLVPAVLNDKPQVFVRDRWTQQTELISVAMGGGYANWGGDSPAISANGRHVAFLSRSINLVPDDSYWDWDIFVRDRQLGTTTRVTVGPSGERAQNTNSVDCYFNLSADGRFIAFAAAFPPNPNDVYVWLRDRDADGNGIFDEPGGVATTQISPTPIGSASSWHLYSIAISANGRIIAYHSRNSQDGTDGMLFAYDRETGLTQRIDIPAAGLPDVVGESFAGDLDDEGRFLVYTSDAPNIVENDGDAFEDLFLFDFQTGINTRLRPSHAGAPSLQMYTSPSISGNGRYVSFIGMLRPYTTFHSFVIDLQTGSSRELSFGESQTPDVTPSYGISGMSMNGDGSAIAFMDGEDNRKVFTAIDLSLSLNAVDLPQEGGTFAFDVSAPENIPWTARTLSPAQIAVQAPASGIGSGQVSVNVLPNTSGIDGNIFVYVGSEQVHINQPSLSTILSVTPSSGPMTGGTVVQITGRAFTEGATVTFGGVQATDVVVLDTATIQATTPSTARAGSVEVVVHNPDGSVGRRIAGFEYEDPTPPVITAKITGTLGNNGWYTSNVDISWEVSDPESAITSKMNCTSMRIASDTTYIARCTATSLGGTTDKSVEIKRDATPPEIRIKTPQSESSYELGAQVAADYNCYDYQDGSGIAECSGSVVPGAFLDTTTIGTHTFSVTTRDAAGNESTATASYTIVRANPTITWPAPTAITYGTPLGAAQLNATANVPGAFTYTPASGTILPAGVQTLTVNFVPNDTNYFTASASVSITVQKATPLISWIPYDLICISPLSSSQLNATANVPGTFTYAPAAGTYFAPGTYTLSATFVPNDTANYATAAANASLLVKKAIPYITWVPGVITCLSPLSSSQLNASAGIPGVFTYTPAAGTLLPLEVQILSVTFVPNDTIKYEVATKSVTVTVIKAKATVIWNPGTAKVGLPLDATQLNAYASNSVPGTFTYTPPAGTIFSAVGNQTLSVTFVPNDTANYDPTNLSISIAVQKGTPTITWTNPLPDIIYGTPLGDAQLSATANMPGTFMYSPAAGTILNAGNNQFLYVDFTPNDTANYETKRYFTSITVQKATSTITWAAPNNIAYPTPLSSVQLNAIANVPGTFTYTPAAGTSLTPGTYMLTARFVPTSGNYETASKTVSITVQKGTPVITWAAPTNITYGTALSSAQLNATSNVLGIFSYTPGAGSVLSVGVQTLTVIWTSYYPQYWESASKSVSITVQKAVPTISWTPAGISYGTPLGASQLNATANTTGTFTYTPAAGTILPAGLQTLMVNFVPDSSNYEASSKSATITVAKSMPTVSWTPSGMTYGTPLGTAQLNATAGVAGAFTYTPAAGTILTVGTQVLSLTFVPEDTADYSTVNKSASIMVQKATPTITWPTPENIVYGKILNGTQLNATANTPGMFTYSPVSGTYLQAGTHLLSVSFTPSNSTNYNPSSASVYITVIPATLEVRVNDYNKLYGQALPSFTATVTGLAAGDTIESLGGLVFTTSASATSAPGSYQVATGGLSSANYLIRIYPGMLTITKAPTSTTLVSSPNPSTNRQTVRITATIAPIAPGAGLPTGSVQFFDNGASLGTASLVNGVATLSVSLRKGTHTLAATYPGDTNFLGSSGTRSHQVQ
jgi:hypothetical protein